MLLRIARTVCATSLRYLALVVTVAAVLTATPPAGAQPISVSPEDIPPVASGPRPPIVPGCPPNAVPVTLTPSVLSSHSRHYIDRPKITWGQISVSRAGWYDIYDESPSDSGFLQRNEQSLLYVTNRVNPEGKPATANCGEYWAIPDMDNVRPATDFVYAGTFWLEAGSNDIAMAPLCAVVRAGFCTGLENIEDPLSHCATVSTTDNSWQNSAHLHHSTICLVPNGSARPPRRPAGFRSPASFSQSFTGMSDGDILPGWASTVGLDTFPRSAAARFRVRDDNGNMVFGTANSGTAPIATFDLAGDRVWEAPFWRNYEFSGRMKFTDSGGAAGVTFLSSLPDSSFYYGLKTDSSERAFHFWAQGTSISGGRISTGVRPAPNTWYHFKIQAIDEGPRTQLRARVWREGSSEPNGWQAEAFDDTLSRVRTGSFGVWGGVNAPGEKLYDDLQVSPLP
ncbi:MAG: hypothetical protein KDD69_18720 [Bdellovibrionales bacterium]|nr:hypothetical protein [Bdellovibrionales bacterium]